MNKSQDDHFHDCIIGSLLATDFMKGSSVSLPSKGKHCKAFKPTLVIVDDPQSDSLIPPPSTAAYQSMLEKMQQHITGSLNIPPAVATGSFVVKKADHDKLLSMQQHEEKLLFRPLHHIGDYIFATKFQVDWKQREQRMRFLELKTGARSQP